MKAPGLLAAVLSIAYLSAAAGQESAAAKPYDVDEAYRVYSVLLPHEESYGFAKGTVVIQQETVSDQHAAGACLTAEAAEKFKDAISDFDRADGKPLILQRQFRRDQTLLQGARCGLGRFLQEPPRFRRFPCSVRCGFQQGQDFGYCLCRKRLRQPRREVGFSFAGKGGRNVAESAWHQLYHCVVGRRHECTTLTCCSGRMRREHK